MSEMETLPCGCRMGQVEDAFVMEPCQPDCQFWRYALSQARQQGKPVRMISDPELDEDTAARYEKLARDVDGTCPYCQRVNTVHRGVGGEGAPRPGDISLCWQCRQLAVYENDPASRQLTLRQVSALEKLETLVQYPHLRDLLASSERSSG